MNSSKQAAAYKSGEILFHEGDISECMYIVKSGKIGIKRANESYVVTIGKDEFFGEMGFFDNLPRSASAVAEIDSEVWEIGHSDFDSQLSNLPVWCKKFFRILSQRLRDTNDRVKYEVLGNKFNQFIQLIDLLGHRYGQKSNQGFTLSMELIKEKVTALLDVNLHLLQNMLKQLDDLDHVSVSKEGVTVSNQSLFEKYTTYTQLSSTINESFAQISKYSKLSPGVIRFIKALKESIKEEQIPKIGSEYVFNIHYLDKYIPAHLNIVKIDVDDAMEYHFVVKKSENEYAANLPEIDNIQFFQESQKWSKWLFADPMRTFNQYLLKNVQQNGILQEEFRDQFKEIFGHPISEPEFKFLNKLKLFLPNTDDSLLLPDQTTIQMIESYVTLHKELFVSK